MEESNFKRVIIIGKNSFLGKAINNNLERNGYDVTVVDSFDDKWKNIDYRKIDVVINVAGYLHKKQKRSNKEMYFEINSKLAYSIFKYVSKFDVLQYIYISSMNVYGNVTGCININTKLNPNSYYGYSKVEAEKLLLNSNAKKIKVSIIRPPLIYGNTEKGNFPKFRDFIQKHNFFIKCDNKKNFIYVKNLAEFIHLIIKFKKNGIFFPQNKMVISTYEFAKHISEVNGKHLRVLRFPRFIMDLFIKTSSTFFSLFGTQYYDKSLSQEFNYKYCLYDFEESLIDMKRDTNNEN